MYICVGVTRRVSADSVRSVRLTPANRPVLHVGDEVTCSASGNPTPRLTLSPVPPAGESAAGRRGGKVWTMVAVPVEWTDNVQTVSCVAVNYLNGTRHRVNVTISFNVTGPSAQHATFDCIAH